VRNLSRQTVQGKVFRPGTLSLGAAKAAGGRDIPAAPPTFLTLFVALGSVWFNSDDLDATVKMSTGFLLTVLELVLFDGRHCDFTEA
jgi:hypothetical protein